jgi:hypothetical protein
MSYSISMTGENHGHQIRLMKQTEYIPKSVFTEVATITITDNRIEAEAIMKALNRLIYELVKEKVIEEHIIRYKGGKY